MPIIAENKDTCYLAAFDGWIAYEVADGPTTRMMRDIFVTMRRTFNLAMLCKSMAEDVRRELAERHVNAVPTELHPELKMPRQIFLFELAALPGDQFRLDAATWARKTTSALDWRVRGYRALAPQRAQIVTGIKNFGTNPNQLVGNIQVFAKTPNFVEFADPIIIRENKLGKMTDFMAYRTT